MPDKPLPVSIQLKIEVFDRFLESKPQLASNKALEYYKKYLVLGLEYEELRQKYLQCQLNSLL